jgi:hypothetical protein
VPELNAMHEYAGHLPTESIHVHGLSFRSSAWFDAKLGQVPSYAKYMSQCDPAEAYRYEKRVLKLLQWKNPRRTWVMKSPVTLSHLPSVLEVYPDVGFIWTHRDPVKAVASIVSLVGALHWVRTDEPFLGDTLAMVTDAGRAARLMSQPIEWLEQGAVPKDRLCNIQYVDLVADPLAAVEQIYATFGIEMTAEGRAAMDDHVHNQPRSARPAHEYDMGSDALREEERALFKRYQAYFDVMSEI